MASSDLWSKLPPTTWSVRDQMLICCPWRDERRGVFQAKVLMFNTITTSKGISPVSLSNPSGHARLPAIVVRFLCLVSSVSGHNSHFSWRCLLGRGSSKASGFLFFSSSTCFVSRINCSWPALNVTQASCSPCLILASWAFVQLMFYFATKAWYWPKLNFELCIMTSRYNWVV